MTYSNSGICRNGIFLNKVRESFHINHEAIGFSDGVLQPVHVIDGADFLILSRFSVWKNMMIGRHSHLLLKNNIHMLCSLRLVWLRKDGKTDQWILEGPPYQLWSFSHFPSPQIWKKINKYLGAVNRDVACVIGKWISIFSTLHHLIQ